MPLDIFAYSATRRPRAWKAASRPRFADRTSRSSNVGRILRRSLATNSRLFLRPPGIAPARAYSTAPSRNRHATASISSVTPLASAISRAWPSRPNPVTSVTPCTSRPRHGLGGGAIQREHGGDGSLHVRRVARPRFRAVAMTPVPIFLVSTSTSPGRGAGVGFDPVGSNGAGDCIAEFDFGIVDAVAAEDHASRFVDFFRAALEDLLEVVQIAGSRARPESRAPSRACRPSHRCR